jgi:hypothetical protein
VEDSLVDVVTPDELTMQKYWPAHDAVAKLRHEAAISEIKTSARNSVSEIVRSISDRLDKMKRSSAASFTAGSGSIQIPFSELAASSRSQPHVGHPPSSATPADVATVNSGQSVPSFLS